FEGNSRERNQLYLKCFFRVNFTIKSCLLKIIVHYKCAYYSLKVIRIIDIKIGAKITADSFITAMKVWSVSLTETT
uniref:Uncharacterized protein n=1 Tax=Anopheles albimanus TaxID=7167 RepID=A0A182FWL8_ANOAL